MIPVTTDHRNYRAGVVRTSARRDDLVLIALPWMPLLSGESFFRVVGSAAFIVVGAMLLYAFCVRTGRSDMSGGPVAIVGLLLIGCASTRSLQAQSFVQVAQLTLMALAVRVGPLLRFSRNAERVCVASSVLLPLAALVDLLLSGGLMFANSNAYGVASLCWVAVLAKLLVGRGGPFSALPLLASLVLPITLALVSESRASLVAIASLAMWPIIGAPIRSRKLRSALVLLVLLLPLLSIALVVLDGFAAIQDLIPEFGEKSAFSGRNVIWLDIALEIAANDYWGHGLGSLPGAFLDETYEGLSAHNGFLQVAYQFGAIGLAVFLGACALTMVALAQREDRGVSVAILGAALVHEVFEVVMTQNHFGSGLLLWVVATIVLAPMRRANVGRGLT